MPVSNGAYRFSGLVPGNANLSAKVAGYDEVRSGVYIDGANTLDFVIGYDGRWVGFGRGTSSASTTATIDIDIQVSNGVITSLRAPWRIDTPSGTVESSFCGSTGVWPDTIPINGKSFSVIKVRSGFYTETIRGEFTSAHSLTGTATFVNTGAPPRCLNATINWTAVVRQ